MECLKLNCLPIRFTEFVDILYYLLNQIAWDYFVCLNMKANEINKLMSEKLIPLVSHECRCTY